MKKEQNAVTVSRMADVYFNYLIGPFFANEHFYEGIVHYMVQSTTFDYPRELSEPLNLKFVHKI